MSPLRWLRASASPWLVGLPISLALHLVAVVTALAFLRSGPAPSGIVVDLSEIVARSEEREPSSSASSSAVSAARGGPLSDAPPAPSTRGPRALASAPPALRPATREPLAPAPAPPQVAAPPAPAPPPPDVPARQAEPSPIVAAADPGPAPSAVSSAPSVAPSPSGPQPASGASGRDAGVAGVGSGFAGAGGPSSGSGIGGGQGTRAGGGAGDRLAAIAPGGDGGPGSDYGPYQSRLRQRIQDTLRYPPSARRRGLSGTVQLEIGVQPDGSIGAVSVVASSSHEVLDQAAVNAVRALPRMPFPSDVRPAPFTVRLPVVFELRDR